MWFHLRALVIHVLRRLITIGRSDESRSPGQRESFANRRDLQFGQKPRFIVLPLSPLDGVVLRLTGYRDRRGRDPKRGDQGSAARGLTIAAMTGEGRQRLGRTDEPNRTPSASTGKLLCHVMLPPMDKSLASLTVGIYEE